MEEIRALLAQFTVLDASLYGVALPMAVLLRFCRAYWAGFGDRATLLVGAVLGVGGAYLSAADAEMPRPIAWIGAQAISLIVAVLVAELASRKLPWLPKDNALIHLKDNPPPAP